MMQTRLTRAEAIEYLLAEFTNSYEYQDGMDEYHELLLEDYIDSSDDYMEQVEEAKAEILASYQDSDDFKEEMAGESNSLIAAHRAHLESLSDDALAEEVSATIESEGD